MTSLKWGVTIITSPRETPTLNQCRDSLYRAGWINHARGQDVAVSYDHDQIGCYTHWQNALRSLLDFCLFADYLMVVEDDAVFSAGCRRYLDLYPPSPDCINSLYCAAPNHRDDAFGWHEIRVPQRAYGALAYAMTPAMARRFLSFPPLSTSPNLTDRAMGIFCQRERIPYLCHSPSLVQHIGDTSTLPEAGIDECRKAKRWLQTVELVE